MANIGGRAQVAWSDLNLNESWTHIASKSVINVRRVVGEEHTTTAGIVRLDVIPTKGYPPQSLCDPIENEQR